MKEKHFMILSRLFWFVVLLAAIIIPIILVVYDRNAEIEIVDDSAYISDYDDYFNDTDVEVEVTFNRGVLSADIEVAFYDSGGRTLATEDCHLYGSGKTLSGTVYSVPGKVDSYEITAFYSVESDDSLDLWAEIIGIVGGMFGLGFFILSLLLSCKHYTYNGDHIIVYSGWFKHYIKVNGRKYDEHNTLMTALRMSCTLDDGANAEVVISLTNRIALKVNGRLLYPVKEKEIEKDTGEMSIDA